jgi:hypothetical protein
MAVGIPFDQPLIAHADGPCGSRAPGTSSSLRQFESVGDPEGGADRLHVWSDSNHQNDTCRHRCIYAEARACDDQGADGSS